MSRRALLKARRVTRTARRREGHDEVPEGCDHPGAESRTMQESPDRTAALLVPDVIMRRAAVRATVKGLVALLDAEGVMGCGSGQSGTRPWVSQRAGQGPTHRM
jgi:hypothetical protein